MGKQFSQILNVPAGIRSGFIGTQDKNDLEKARIKEIINKGKEIAINENKKEKHN